MAEIIIASIISTVGGALVMGFGVYLKEKIRIRMNKKLEEQKNKTKIIP